MSCVCEELCPEPNTHRASLCCCCWDGHFWEEWPLLWALRQEMGEVGVWGQQRLKEMFLQGTGSPCWPGSMSEG